MLKALTEAQAEMQPDAVACRVLLEARLSRCSEAEAAAFWEAVRRCYGGSPEGDMATTNDAYPRPVSLWPVSGGT